MLCGWEGNRRKVMAAYRRMKHLSHLYTGDQLRPQRSVTSMGSLLPF